jgi:hypothetical protein
VIPPPFVIILSDAEKARPLSSGPFRASRGSLLLQYLSGRTLTNKGNASGQDQASRFEGVEVPWLGNRLTLGRTAQPQVDHRSLPAPRDRQRHQLADSCG